REVRVDGVNDERIDALPRGCGILGAPAHPATREEPALDEVARLSGPPADSRKASPNGGAKLLPRVPLVIDPGNQLADPRVSERGALQAEVLEQAGDLWRRRKGCERDPPHGREDQEVQAHADAKVEVAHEVEHLARRVTAAHDFDLLRVPHAG